jgi:tetratricopeptide (TPR) repeat protein
MRLFYKAIELDPGFALAYALVARCFARRKENGWRADVARETAEAARASYRTIEIGKDDSVALSFAAHVLAYVVGDLDAAASACERALSQNTNVAMGWASSGYVKVLLGDPEVGIEHEQRAMRLSPHDPHIHLYYNFTAMACFYAGRHDEAVDWAESAVRERPHSRANLRTYAASLAATGRVEDAQRIIERLCKLAPSLRLSNMEDVLPPFRRSEYRAKYIEALRTAGLPE